MLRATISRPQLYTEAFLVGSTYMPDLRNAATRSYYKSGGVRRTLNRGFRWHDLRPAVTVEQMRSLPPASQRAASSLCTAARGGRSAFREQPAALESRTGGVNRIYGLSSGGDLEAHLPLGTAAVRCFSKHRTAE